MGDAQDLPEQAAARPVQPLDAAFFALTGDAEVLAGKACANDVDVLKVVAPAVAHVVKLLGVGEVLGEDFAAMGLDFDLPRGLKTGSFKSEVKTSDACKQAANGGWPAAGSGAGFVGNRWVIVSLGHG